MIQGFKLINEAGISNRTCYSAVPRRKDGFSAQSHKWKGGSLYEAL
jgi:hypothetical protein